MLNKKRQVILIFGKTGTGKSTLAKKLMKEYTRKIIIDTQIEYRDGIIFYNYNSLRIWLMKNYDNEKNFSLILRFQDDNELEQFFNLAYELQNYVLVMEEAELYISPFAKKHSFLRLVRYGRHKNISLIGIARRASELSSDFQAQVNIIYTFKQTIPLDVEKMERLGLFGVQNLPEHSYIKKDF